jgi:putative membrane protein
MATHLVSDQDKLKISQVVALAEKGTSGEIVPMVVGQSDDYPDARWRIAVTFSLLAAFVLHSARPDLSVAWYLWVQVPALFVGYSLGALHPILRLFLVRHKVLEHVHGRALRSFHAQGLNATRDRTGVLIFVSLLERRVEIFADSGIAARVKPEEWNQIVHDLIAQIKGKMLADGLCQAISRCGSLLQTHFPARPDDRDELSNQLVVES